MARNFLGISCEKSRFYAKKILLFPILGGGAPGAPPPLDPPLAARTQTSLYAYRCGRDRMVVEMTINIQSVFITTKVACSNSAHGDVYSIQQYVIICLSMTCCRSVVFSGYSGFFHQQNWPSRYSWNIFESGVKHHNPKPKP